MEQIHRVEESTRICSMRRDDLNIAGSVGEEARNRPAEVIKVKKALSNTGLFDFDVTKEKSTAAGRGILPPPSYPPAGPRILDWRGWRCL